MSRQPPPVFSELSDALKRAAPPSVDGFKESISPDVAAAAVKLEQQYNSARERIENEISALRQAWATLAVVDPRPSPPASAVSGPAPVKVADAHASHSQAVVIPGIHDSEDVLTIVVLGATGDLAKKLTFPALFALFTAKFMPNRFHIVGVGRQPAPGKPQQTAQGLREHLCSNAGTSKAAVSGPGTEEFFAKCSFIHANYDSASDFEKLDQHCKALEESLGGRLTKANRLFYFALPPTVFAVSAASINASARASNGWTRAVIEKPFGSNSASYEELSLSLSASLTEDEMYRIDHFLAKEVVQNLLTLKFGNGIFNPIWNRNFISSVQVTFKEDIGTDGRGGYFDSFGIVRDVCQNHLLQILALVAADFPVSLSSDDIRDEKVKVVRSIRPINLQDCVLGQYGKSVDGKQPSYLDDKTVPPGSVTPTYACIKFFIDNPQWDGVPFIMKAGKALDNKKTEVRIQFKGAMGNLYGDAAPNELVLRVQPGEAMYMKLNGKMPGMGHEIGQVELDMTYGSRFKDVRLPLAYERLILDVMRGDHSLFVRDDELKHAWKLFDPLLEAIDNKSIPVHIYPRGSRGPPQGDHMVATSGYTRNEKYSWK